MAPTQPKIGILGAGQLSLYLVKAAQRLGLPCHLWSPRAEEPAASLAPTTVGALGEGRVLRAFLESVDRVTFENEFLDTRYLGRLQAEFPHLSFAPSLEVIERIQDKGQQKRLLDSLNIPTAPWTLLEGTPSEVDHQLRQGFAQGAVLKWTRQGYDGKGVWFWEPSQAATALEPFLAGGRTRGGSVYAEARIPFRRELAVLVTRAQNGELVHYPLVQSQQDRGVCSLVCGPATGLGNTVEQELQAVEIASRLAQSLNYVGTLAVELFETTEGHLLVNEIAPRVHNSGHYSLDGAATDQFENHLRAVARLPLGPTRTAPFFCMLNLLGPECVSGVAEPQHIPTAPEGVFVHWYGKRELRPRRKLGHLNATATSPAELARMVKTLQQVERSWKERLSGEEMIRGE